MLAFKQNVFYFLELILSWDSPSSDCCVFDQQTHACPCARMVKNDEKHLKIMKKYLFHHAYERLMKKNKEKSLLVSDWEWLPKAGWHPNAGCSFGILLFFVLFPTCTSHVHYDIFWKTLLRMTPNVLWKLYYTSLIYWIEPVSWCESCTPYSSKTHWIGKIGFQKYF